MGLSERTTTGDETGYLCVDRFTSTLVGTRALATAFEVGFVDLLLEEKTAGRSLLSDRLKIDGQGLDILLSVLTRSGVIEENNGTVVFTEQFRKALEYRDLMEVRATLSHLCALDLIDHFTSLIKDPDRFLGSTRLFRLFDYGHATVPGSENLERTRNWVRMTTTLTKYEAGVVMKHHDFSRYSRVLDIGGNSGEFVLRICREHPEMMSTVFDLPQVCDVGRQHVAGEPESGRIDFIGGNALTDTLPGEFDAVVLKSILHDWPEAAARRFIQRAGECVVPGGIVIIFERGPLDIGGSDIPYHLVPYLLFARFFRTPELYVDELAGMGFEDVRIERIELEMPFFMVTGVKPRG